MNHAASPSSASLSLVQRLLARETAVERAGDPETVGAALQRLCLRVSARLRDSLGEDGCNALLARALARTEGVHPVLKNIRRIGEGTIQLDGVMGSANAHGIVAVTTAVEALFAALLDILGRLIGEDMALQLLDYDVPRSRTSSGAHTP